MPDMPGTQKLCFKFICCNFAYVYNEVFACGTHIPQHICLEESYNRLFSYFHKIHAGTYKHLMHKKVHLMSCRIICRKRELQKGGIMWKGVRMTWMVWLKSSIMLNYCFHCHKNENGWNMRQRLCDHLCAANRHISLSSPRHISSYVGIQPHHGKRIEYFQELHARLVALESCIFQAF